MTGRQAMTNSRQAFEVVDAFEQAVARYTGAPYCVAVDSGCHALFLCLTYQHSTIVSVPKNTYVGVPMAVCHAESKVAWRDENWNGIYDMGTQQIIDAALRFTSGMYEFGTKMCLSFQASKLLPIGRGGAILHDDTHFDQWVRRARNNGRAEGALCGKEHGFPHVGWNMWMTPPDAARGLWLLTYYPEHMPDQGGAADFEDIRGEGIFT